MNQWLIPWHCNLIETVNILFLFDFTTKKSTVIIAFLPFHFSSVLGMTMPATSCRCLHSSQSHLNSTTLPLQRTQAEQSEEENVTEQLSENDRVNPHFINRNPRNLELMAVARKDKGWSQSYPRKDYWHK